MRTIAVTGSRKLGSDAFSVALDIDSYFAALAENGSVRVIHGAAAGVDSICAEAAERHGHEVVAMPADWKTHGKKAGVLRNLEMLDKGPDAVVAWWNGESRGTKHMIEAAQKRGIPVVRRLR